jgi:hypothetical protein
MQENLLMRHAENESRRVGMKFEAHVELSNSQRLLEIIPGMKRRGIYKSLKRNRVPKLALG